MQNDGLSIYDPGKGSYIMSQWYDNFGENQIPLHKNGMTAIPKTFGDFFKPFCHFGDFLIFWLH